MPKPRIGQYVIRPFAPEQVAKLLEQPDVTAFVGLRDAALMCFLLDNGCRISEALSLTDEGLDLQARQATVLGKGRKERKVPFGKRTQAWLEAYLERRGTNTVSDCVFVNQYGERLTASAMSHRIAAYGRQAGLKGVPASPHTFRHTFAVWWLLGGGGGYKGDALSLQAILGLLTLADYRNGADLLIDVGDPDVQGLGEP